MRTDPVIVQCRLVHEEWIGRPIESPVAQGATTSPAPSPAPACVLLPVLLAFNRSTHSPAAVCCDQAHTVDWEDRIGKIQQLERRVRASRSPPARCRPIWTGRAALFRAVREGMESDPLPVTLSR
ncbi:MAG: hypothetical protein OXC68_00710 [Aestuariivita sp.]|nr:hypothetical protein [Aestuariivita sp.]